MTDIARLQHLARSGDAAAAEALATAYRRGARPALPPLPPSVCGGGADAGEIMGAVIEGVIQSYLDRKAWSSRQWATWHATHRLGMYCARQTHEGEPCAQQGEWTTTTQTPRRQTDHITIRNYNPIILPPPRITIGDLS